MNKTKKRRFQFIALISGFVAMTLGVLFSSGKGLNNLIRGFASNPTPSYTITLDSSNKVTSAGEVTQHTASGYGVVFTYGSVSSSTSGHVTLNANGTLTNKDHIRSIQSITATFSGSGTLKFKSAYGGEAWSSETEMESGHTYELGSAPYYIYLKSYSNSVTISSLSITYSCIENPDALPIHHDAEDSWNLVTDLSTLNSNDEVLVVGQNDSNYYALDNTQVGTYYYFVEATEITLGDNGTTAQKTSSHTVWTLQKSNSKFTMTSTSGNSTVGLYGGIYTSSGNKKNYNLALSSRTNYTNQWEISQYTNESVDIEFTTGVHLDFKYYNSTTPEFFGSSEEPTANIFLFKRVSIAAYDQYNTPLDCVGFTAVDANANLYKTTSIFATENGLSVYAHYTDGSDKKLTNGANGYSYTITNSLDQVIDPSSPFGTEGYYTLVVSYQNYIPVEIQLQVEFDLVLTGIEVVSTNTIFNTAQKLSDFTSGITVNLTYNRESDNETDIPYSSFASKGLSLTLLNPSQVNYSIDSLFGTAGTWTIKVVSTSNPSVYGTVGITVNAIPVTAISVTGAAATVEAESQLQLTASVTPNNATIQTVTWASNHTSIATVNTNGLVTGVSEGKARITATANDGSAVYGYIDITVTPKPIQTDFDADMSAGTGASACTVDGNEGVKVGTSKKSGSMTITVGAGATRLSFYAASWSGTSTVINLTGATIGTTSFSLTADSGVSGSGTAFTLSGTESDYYHETTLSNITSETTITISASTRFVLWKAKYYTAAVEPIYPTAISLSIGSTTLPIGSTAGLDVGYTPEDTNVKNISFASNKTSVATVSEEGIITAVSAGSARITATAEAANNGTVSKYVDITVTTVAVTSVSINKSTTSLTVGGTEQLTATIAPDSATNKNVNWSSDTTTVATVSGSGLVTAIAAGTATITVKSAADNTKKATCTVTVTASGGGSGGSGGSQETFTISYTEFGNSYNGNDGAHSVTGSSSTVLNYQVSGVCTQSSSIQFRKSAAGYIYSTTSLTLYSVELVGVSAGSFSVYGGNSANPSTAVSGSNDVYDLSGYTYFKVLGSGTAKCTSIIITTGAAVDTDPESISISPSSLELSAGGSKDLAVNYYPTNANHNKEVTWTRLSGSSNITVNSSGKVSVSSNATAGNTATIQAKLTNLTSIKATCTVTVVEQTQDDQTILIYLCGSDLESNGQTNSSSAAGYASGDLTEILKVGSQPDDVNVVIETGGAKCWKTTHGINKNYLERYHVANKSLVRDSQETKANMGLTSTLQSFLTWGVQTYPADRISLILWDHGGAMHGVCYDENYGSDSLSSLEVKNAVANTFTSLGRSTSDKFEWIGYDACLMQVQDIAEFNSQYFNYMIASEESEAGAGWDYDNWLDDAYAKKTTPDILKAICDSFLAEQGSSSDQTLSYLDLSYMSTYKSAWETMSSTIKPLINTYGKSNFQTLMKSCQYYGSDSDCEGYSYFGIIDAKDVMNKLSSNNSFSTASSQISAAITAFTNLVAYSKKGTKAGNSYGLCCYFPMTDGSGYTCQTSKYYTASDTNFTNWRSIVTTYGTN